VGRAGLLAFVAIRSASSGAALKSGQDVDTCSLDAEAQAAYYDQLLHEF
jgi:hypothetical protein